MRPVVLLAAPVALLATVALAQPVSENGRKFSTTMSGAEECNAAGTCGVGDSDGTGTARVTINPGQRRVCWEITVDNIEEQNRAHIHRAPAGSNGGIVVDFFNFTPGPLVGCTTQPLDRALLVDIIQHPDQYYVNVHNVPFPAGAIRGQLSKKAD